MTHLPKLERCSNSATSSGCCNSLFVDVSTVDS